MKIRPSLFLAAILPGSVVCLPSFSRAAVITGVTVTESAPAHSAPYPAEKAVDGDAADYASANLGADTFLKFAFPAVQAVNRIVVISRDSAATQDWIGNFTLTFDGGLTSSHTRTAIRGGSAIIPLGATYNTASVRLDVDTTGNVAAGGNTGVMEVLFLSPMTGKNAISGVTVTGSATPFSVDFAAANAVDGIVGRSAGAGSKLEYASAGLGLGAFVDFDLGVIQPVAGFDFFDRPAAADRVSAFDLIFSLNAIFGDGDDVVQSFSHAGMASSAEFAAINARYVRYDVTAKSGAGVNTGLSEMIFYTPVPEPSAAIAGLAALTGLALRRRRG